MSYFPVQGINTFNKQNFINIMKGNKITTPILKILSSKIKTTFSHNTFTSREILHMFTSCKNFKI